jgi:hypothetical protein
MELSQTTAIVKEEDVKDVNDDDSGTEMNRQVLLKDLSPPKATLYYN